MMLVIREDKRDKKRNLYVLCKCDCGKEKVVRLSSLKSGDIKSCGCLRKSLAKEMFCKNKFCVKHGLSRTRLYRIWQAMKQRCMNKNRNSFNNYGGRGITVCDCWKDSFERFREWAISNGYSDNLTIDRIDVNGDYCPENCRWITNDEQQNNRRNNHFVEYHGHRYTLAQLSRKLNIAESTLWRIANVDTSKLEKNSNF